MALNAPDATQQVQPTTSSTVQPAPLLSTQINTNSKFSTKKILVIGLVSVVIVFSALASAFAFFPYF